MMRHTFELDEAHASQIYDVIVIGAGVVGIFLAARLARMGFRIALVEGGGETSNTIFNARHTNINGRRHSSTESGRAMGLGGTSVLWGGQLAELSASDIRENKGWPISHQELSALYERTYTALGLPVRPSYEQARIGFGGDEGVHGGVERIFSYWLPNPNFATLFRHEVVLSEHVQVFVDSKAIGFNFDESGRTTGVIVRSPKGEVTLRASQYVVAGGVVESNRLLLAAQLNERCPWSKNNVLGCFFQDHLGGEIGSLTIHDDSKFREFFETGFVKSIKLMPKLRFCASDAQEVSGASSISAFPSYYSNMSEHISNIKAMLRSIRTGTAYEKWRDLPASVWNLGRSFAPLVYRYAVQKRVFALFDRGVRLSIQCNQSPFIQSRIKLDSQLLEKDGLPKVRLEWRTSGNEAQTLGLAAAAFGEYFERNKIATLTLDPHFSDTESFVDRLLDTSHPSGGIRMSIDSNSGVTDQNARIWGSPNTFVAGASILPNSGEANITLTALAFALRLADHLTALRDSQVSVSSSAALP